jgi:hypothetical protein
MQSERDISDAMRMALKTCLAGHADEGLAQFRSAFRQYDSLTMPAALYVRFLQDAGQTETADRLRNLALRAGADLNVSRFAPSATNETQLAEYRALFDAKIVNATMIANYLVLLSGMGITDEIARHHGDEVIRSYSLAGADAAAIKPDLVRDEILERMKKDRGRSPSIMNAYVVDLAGIDDVPEKSCLADMPETRRLIDIVAAVGKAFKKGARKSNSLFWAMEPDDIVLAAWAVVSEGAGYSVPHLHPRAWMAGVFYAAAPDWAVMDSNDDGNLRIGQPRGIPDGAPGWPDLSFAPIPGRLVLLPAYASHWTVPLHRPGLRISVAVDFMPRD